MSPGADWRPGITAEALQARAALLARTRAFFAARGVLEVDTPLVVNAAVTDVHIHSAQVLLEADDGQAGRRPLFLHSSPEYAMKRLLAAGSGDIYQICHVVRGAEYGRLHNPEFTLIEWYRVGWDLDALMGETAELATSLLGAAAAPGAPERLAYRDAFLRELGLDPLTAADAELAACAARSGFAPSAPASRDELLELLMGTVIGPRLGRERLCLLHAWPASQAALARLDPRDARTARRFELYYQGVELANGFEELADAGEQRERFRRDLEQRRRAGLPCPAPDERLLAALESGLPPCAGVALGFDRTLMLARAAGSLAAVLPFTTRTA